MARTTGKDLVRKYIKAKMELTRSGKKVEKEQKQECATVAMERLQEVVDCMNKCISVVAVLSLFLVS